MGRDPCHDETGSTGSCRTHGDRHMPTPHSAARHVLLDAHEGRGLASTILIANELLDHDDLDDSQRLKILQSLARAATTLAHHVVSSDEVPAREPA